ncbi:unnamed protein product, partial [Prunus brigantina]
NLTNLKSRGYPDEELGGQEKSRTTQEVRELKIGLLEIALQFSFNGN